MVDRCSKRILEIRQLLVGDDWVEGLSVSCDKRRVTTRLRCSKRNNAIEEVAAFMMKCLVRSMRFPASAQPDGRLQRHFKRSLLISQELTKLTKQQSPYQGRGNTAFTASTLPAFLIAPDKRRATVGCVGSPMQAKLAIRQD